MKREAAEILKDVLALPAEDRTALAGALLDSLNPRTDVRNRIFERARYRALRRLREGLDLQWVPSGSRDDLHRR